MRKFTLKSLIAVSAMLIGGASVANADTWSIDFTAVGANYDDKTPVTISETVAKIGGVDMGTCTVVNEALNSNFVLQIGTSWLMYSAGLYQFNGGGRAMGMLNCKKDQVITIKGTGDPNPTTNATLKSSGDGTYVYTVTADGGVKFTPARYLYFSYISVEDPSTTEVNYTVKYVDENGTELKDQTTYSGEPGNPAVIYDSDKASFDANNNHYIYKSDDAEGKTIAGDGTTVISVTFRVAELYSYTVKSDSGKELASGSAYEQETVIVAFPQFEMRGTDLFETEAGDKNIGYYRKNIVLTSDNMEVVVNYTKNTIANVVYYSEAEDIEGATAYSGNNANIRCSNGTGAAFNEDTKVTTLPAGKYKIWGQVFGNASTEFSIKAGDNVVWTLSTVGYLTNVLSEEFEVSTETDIIIVAAGNSGRTLDCLYIQKTGDVAPETIEVTMASCGYATLCSEYALDFSENEDVKAYIATELKDGKVVTEQIQMAAAGEGIILKSSSASVTIATTTESVEKNENNKMVGDPKNAISLTANQGYILSANDGLFHPCSEGTLAAGKAYLAIDVQAANGAKVLTLDFAEEGMATAINEVETTTTSDAVFTLGGTRMIGQPTQRGIYIVGGKKVVIK